MSRARSSWFRRLRRLVPALVLLVPACDFHCGGASAKKDAALVSDSGSGRVEVVRTGSKPRIKLTVGRWAGLRYQLQLTSSVSFGVEGQPPLRPPATVARLDYKVLRGTANPIQHGGRPCVEEQAVLRSLRVLGGGLPPALAAQTNKELGALDGTTVRQLVTDDGEIAEMKTELVAGKKPAPQVQKALDQVWDAQRHFPFRLPQVPVGVGASWRFTEPTELRGVRAMQIADMTITGMDAKSVRIRIRIRQQAPRQELPNPLDPSSTAILEHYRADGQGEFTIDRMTAVMRRGHLAVTASLRLSAINAQGKKQQASFAAAEIVRERARIGAPEAGAGTVDAGTAPRGDASARPSASAAGADRPAP